jgi:hypothetical protein
MHKLRRFNEVLRRETATVDARPAYGALLDHDGRFAQLLRGQRCGKRGGTRAKNAQINGSVHKVFHCKETKA